MRLKPNIASMEAYVPGKTSHGAVKLSSNENPLGPSKKAIHAIQSSLNQINRYPDGASTQLRQSIAHLWETSPANLVIGNGSDEVISLIAAAWLSPGDNAVSARQTFSQYRYAVTLFGGEMREVDLSYGKYNLDGMVDCVDENTRLVFICNPNNPTGTYLSHNAISRFINNLPESAIVVIDEAYADFVEAWDFPDSKLLLKQYNNIVVVRTFSKLYGLAGIRVGYGVGDPILTSGAERASMPFNVNSLGQIAALAALEDEDHRCQTLNLVHREKAFFTGELNRRDIFYYPTEANFICFSLDREVSHIWDAVARGGIAVRDLKSFGLPEMLRYTFGTRENNRCLLSIIDKLQAEK